MKRDAPEKTTAFREAVFVFWISKKNRAVTSTAPGQRNNI